MLVLRYWADRQVEQETALLKETVEGAAKVLSEAAATTKTATDAAKQVSVARARATYFARCVHVCAYRTLPKYGFECFTRP